MKEFIGLILIVIGLIGGVLWYNAKNTGYTSKYQATFLADCEENSSIAKCKCMFNELKENYPFKEAQFMEAQVKNGVVPYQLKRIVYTCS